MRRVVRFKRIDLLVEQQARLQFGHRGRKQKGMPASFLTIRLPGDHLDLDPESAPNVRTRFTAPMAGTFVIQGDFLGNGKQSYASMISRLGQRDAFNLARKMNRGDTVDFVVSTGSVCTNLGTGLKAVITVH